VTKAVASLGDDIETVDRARSGDRAAFAALVDRYWERLRRWLFGMADHPQLAEDLTQEAFFRAWTGLPQLREGGTFRVWLFRIAFRCWQDVRRQPMSRQHHQPISPQLASPASSPFAEAVDRENRSLLHAALHRLPDIYREAYLLWTQEDLPYSALAAVLGCSEATARWRVCKARQHLFRELQAQLDLVPP
jgi:RNA polymerase sigma-70 factor (ECF subfamily)